MSINIVKQKVASKIPRNIDYLLLCASFEERCLSMHECLDSEFVTNTGVFYYKQFTGSSSPYLEKLQGKFEANLYELDYDNPTTVADALINFMSKVNDEKEKPNLVIDISTYTKEALLIIVKYLSINEKAFSHIYLFYRYASVSKYLSDGVVSIRSVLGYMGEISIDKPMHLVLLSGFEHERAKEIIDTLEPDIISIGSGHEEGSITTKLHNLNKEFTNKLIAYYSNENIRTFEFSLKEPLEVKKTILDLVQKMPKYNTVVAPLNNKVSTVGVALAAVENSTIQLIYSQMSEYNESSYSSCVDDCLIYDLKNLII